MSEEPKASCLFCLKEKDEVFVIIAGATVCICNDCIALRHQTAAEKSLPPFTKHHEDRIRELSDEQIVRRAPALARAILEKITRSWRTL